MTAYPSLINTGTQSVADFPPVPCIVYQKEKSRNFLACGFVFVDVIDIQAFHLMRTAYVVHSIWDLLTSKPRRYEKGRPRRSGKVRTIHTGYTPLYRDVCSLEGVCLPFKMHSSSSNEANTHTHARTLKNTIPQKRKAFYYDRSRTSSFRSTHSIIHEYKQKPINVYADYTAGASLRD